jgi:hypothetical protein
MTRKALWHQRLIVRKYNPFRHLGGRKVRIDLAAGLGLGSHH